MPVRDATTDDAPTIARIEAEGEEGSAWTRAAVELMLERGDDALVLLAESDDGPVGFLLGTAIADEGEVLMVRVLPTARRAGHGRALMDAAVTRWQQRGVTQAFLEVHETNTAAQALYQAQGWAPVGRRAHYYRDGGDAIILRKPLPAPSVH